MNTTLRPCLHIRTGRWPFGAYLIAKRHPKPTVSVSFALLHSTRAAGPSSGAVGAAAAEVRGGRGARAGDAAPGFFAAAARRGGGPGAGPLAGQDRGSGRRSRTPAGVHQRAADATVRVATGGRPCLELCPGAAVTTALVDDPRGQTANWSLALCVMFGGTLRVLRCARHDLLHKD